jgi:hypothetical protein
VRGEAKYFKSSQQEEGRTDLVRTLSLIKAFRLISLSARSISMDSTFNPFLSHGWDAGWRRLGGGAPTFRLERKWRDGGKGTPSGGKGPLSGGKGTPSGDVTDNVVVAPISGCVTFITDSLWLDGWSAEEALSGEVSERTPSSAWMAVLTTG